MKRKIFISKIKISQSEKEAVLRVFDSGMVVQGPKVVEFENKFAKFCGAKYAVAANTGTAALHMACYAVGIGSDDEVVTTPFSFVATANCILMSGAKVVFADIDEKTFNLDPKEVKKKLTKKTKAILPVDLYGQVYDYKELKKMTKKKGIFLIEDACQAVGAEGFGRGAGRLGDIGCFSFYATKNIMTGEGGMLVTDNKKFAERARRFRHHGQEEGKRYDYLDLGYNYRMTDFVAALGVEQLKKVRKLNSLRARNAHYFLENLKGIKGLVLPRVIKGRSHVFHQFTIRVTLGFKLSRDSLVNYLGKRNIFCGIYYPRPLHLFPHLRKLGFKKGDFPVAERMVGEVVSLPVHPFLTQAELDYIVRTIKSI